MNELEVRFELNDERDYNNAISYLEKSYKFKCENKQVDKYFKTKGREFENDEVAQHYFEVLRTLISKKSIFAQQVGLKEVANYLGEIFTAAGAKVEAVGIVIEKSFQDGRRLLEEAGIPVFSLARLERFENGKVVFKEADL